MLTSTQDKTYSAHTKTSFRVAMTTKLVFNTVEWWFVSIGNTGNRKLASWMLRSPTVTENSKHTGNGIWFSCLEVWLDAMELKWSKLLVANVNPLHTPPNGRLSHCAGLSLAPLSLHFASTPPQTQLSRNPFSLCWTPMYISLSLPHRASYLSSVVSPMHMRCGLLPGRYRRPL